MKITFLGTGTSQGIPVINCDHPVCFSNDPRDKRLRVSIAIQWDSYTYIIDCGPDFRYQMLRANINRINGILFTHEHADHTAGLDDIRPYSFQMGAVPIYGLSRVIENLKLRFDYIFNEEHKYPGAPSVISTIISNEPFKLHNLQIVPVSILHGKLTILGFTFNGVAYLTDVKEIPLQEESKLQALKILIISAIRKRPHKSHLSLDEALTIIEKLQPEKAFITHVSHYMGFHEEIQESLPKNVYLAYDTLEVNI